MQTNVCAKPQSAQRVLVVDAQPEQRLRLVDWLTQGHFQVDTLDDPRLAVNIAKHGWPGVIVAGHVGEGTSAQNLVEQVHAQDPAVPIILIGNLPLEGAQACLSPTVTEDQLLHEVTHWLSQLPSPPDQSHNTLLLVDDDDRLRNILQNFFELNELNVIAASSGEEALHRLEEAPAPNAMILDIRMPGIGGLEALWQIRQLQPRLPVIVISNLDEPYVQARAITLRVNEYLLKPVNFEYLKALLHSKILWGAEARGRGANGESAESREGRV